MEGLGRRWPLLEQALSKTPGGKIPMRERIKWDRVIARIGFLQPGKITRAVDQAFGDNMDYSFRFLQTAMDTEYPRRYQNRPEFSRNFRPHYEIGDSLFIF